jgi:hypothetical protein
MNGNSLADLFLISLVMERFVVYFLFSSTSLGITIF